MVLTIGCAYPVRERTASATEAIGLFLKHCELAQAPTLVAERRPLAIVLQHDLYEFDPREFDALARDVGAALLRVDDDVTVSELEALLGAAVEAALARRRRQGAVIAPPEDPRVTPSRRQTSPARRRSWADLEAPPSSQRASRA
jgi:hypothetical protein